MTENNEGYIGGKYYMQGDPKGYDSFEEMMKAHPTPWYREIYYWFKRNYEFITHTIPMTIKWSYQRVTRKWSDRDVWSIDWFLCEILPPMLKKLKADKQGIPTEFWEQDESSPDGLKPGPEAEKQAIARWNEVLDNIIYTFETAQKILDYDHIYRPTKTWSNEQYLKDIEQTNKWKQRNFNLYKYCKVLDYDECLRYEKGFDLFKEHFFSLND